MYIENTTKQNNLPTPAGAEPSQVNGRNELKNSTLESLEIQDHDSFYKLRSKALDKKVLIGNKSRNNSGLMQ